MGKSDAKPLRSLLFTPGDQEARIAENAKSGADALFLDLEEPRTPCPESVRVRARGLVREFLDDAPTGPGRPGLLRARAAGRVGHDPARPPGGDGPEPRRASCCRRSPGRPTSTPPTRSSRCVETELGLPVGADDALPDPRERAARSATRTRSRWPRERVAYMGGAVSRFGDIAGDIGFRWTPHGHRDVVHPGEGAHRRARRGDPLSDQRHVGRRQRRPRRAADRGSPSCATSATSG